MNIVAKKDILMNYLNVVQRAVSKKGLVPAMEGILIKATEDGELQLSATDGELSIVANAVKCDTWEPGELILPPKFVNIVKLMPSEMVKIQATPEEAEKFRVKVSSGDSNFTLAGLNGNMFPAVSQDSQGVHLQIEAKSFKELVNNTIFAVAPQSHNPIFEGVLFEVKDNTLFAIASDTYRVAVASTEVDVDNFKVIIPAKILAEINKIVTDPEETLNCIISDKEVKWGYKDFVISSRLLAGEYPDFLRVFPETYETKVTLETAKLNELINRGLLIDHKVKIRTNDFFHLSARAEDGKMEGKIDAETHGEETIVLLNAHYLNDVVKVIDTEKIIVEFNGPIGPCVVKKPGSSYRYLVLPIRQN